VIGDKIIATDPHRLDKERPMYEGVIYKIGDESIKCKFHNEFHSSHHEKEFNIEFGFSRTIFKRQQHALDVFTCEEGLGYDFLFPNKIKSQSPQVDAEINDDGILMINSRPQKWYNNLLNKYQKDAVVNVLRGENRPLPYIFFGCPGSGKTQTVIEAILQIHTNILKSRIIVATPSNSAANLITEMLLNSNGVSSTKFIRLVSNNQVEKDLIPENISRYCATVNIASSDSSQTNNGDEIYEYERTKDKGIRSCLTKNMILDYRIVIATLNCYGALLQMKFGDVFSHVFIDEAGQSIEPETLIPLTLLNKNDGQCILAGDPNQLGPISISRFGKIFNFHTSMLERLLLHHPYYQQIYGVNCNEYDPKFVTKLKINYRALPSLLKVYNDLFYKG
jgi:RNA helicase armi